MTKGFVTALTLAAVTGAALSTAAIPTVALADRMDDEMVAMEGGMGPGGLDLAAVDADKDGKVTLDEIASFRQASVLAADADKDGKLSQEELAAMVLKRMQLRAADMAARMVERQDADGDGLLTAAEMATRPAPDRFFDRADADGDGALTAEEIAAAQDRMAEMRDGRGFGHGHGHRGGGWFGWFGGGAE